MIMTTCPRRVACKRRFVLSFSLALAGLFSATPVLFGQAPPDADKQAVEAFQGGDYDLAVDCATLALRFNPDDAVAYYQRGIAHQAKGENDKAIADLDHALRLDPKNSDAYYWRGDAYQASGEYDKAIADYNLALQSNSKFPLYCLVNRGIAYSAKGDYERAILDFNQAIQLKPVGQVAYLKLAYNNLAWLLATCPQPHFRDGRKAVGYATKACELTQWNDAASLDTLAAACAEAGDFDDAVKWETQFLAFPDINAKVEADGKIRLALYETHQAYHEPAVGSRR